MAPLAAPRGALRAEECAVISCFCLAPAIARCRAVLRRPEANSSACILMRHFHLPLEARPPACPQSRTAIGLPMHLPIGATLPLQTQSMARVHFITLIRLLELGAAERPPLGGLCPGSMRSCWRALGVPFRHAINEIRTRPLTNCAPGGTMSSKCARCDKTVYPTEKFSCLDKVSAGCCGMYV